MKDTLRKLAELALIHLANFAFPLVFTILCGRVLGLHDFGIVSFYTALAAFLGVIIEFDVGWYLRALESTRVLLAITTAVRLSAIGLLWVLVSRPGDMSGALWTYAFVSVATSATAWVALSHRQLARFVRPQWSVIAGLMRRALAIVSAT